VNCPVIKSNDKKRSRLEAMRSLLSGPLTKAHVARWPVTP